LLVVGKRAEGAADDATAATLNLDSSSAAFETDDASDARRTAPDRPVRTPLEALHLDEVRRIRFLALYVVVLSAVVAVVITFLGGDQLAKDVHYAGVATSIAGGLWAIWATRDPDIYAPWKTTLFGCTCALASVSALYYWGIFSSAIVAVPMGLYLFGIGRTTGAATVVLVVTVAAHVLLTTGVASGVIADRGLIQRSSPSALDAIGAASVADFILLATFVTARRLRRSTLDAVNRLDAAVRSMAKRGALLAEAREELRRQLEIGGPGRYTDQELGSFRLGQVLGRGGMGEVYEAVHLESGEPAAVKLLSVGADSKPALVERFQREVRIAASLHAPNLVRVIEFSDNPASMQYLAMERLSGKSLDALLREKGRLPVDEVVDMTRGLGAGLAAAHEAGIVHRDLKPRNVFLHRPEQGSHVWKILDFGVSKLLGGGNTLTRDRLVGTPAHMSPEQARGEEVDHRTDVHALGVIIYRAVTGQPAFSGDDVHAILYAVVNTMPPAPSRVSPVPEGFDPVLAVALAKQPEQRFDDVGQLVAAVEAAAAGWVDHRTRSLARRALAAHPWS